MIQMKDESINWVAMHWELTSIFLVHAQLKLNIHSPPHWKIGQCSSPRITQHIYHVYGRFPWSLWQNNISQWRLYRLNFFNYFSQSTILLLSFIRERLLAFLKKIEVKQLSHVKLTRSWLPLSILLLILISITKTYDFQHQVLPRNCIENCSH